MPRRRRRRREQSRRDDGQAGPRPRPTTRREARADLRRVAGLRARRPDGRQEGLRPAQRRFCRHPPAVEPPRWSVPVRHGHEPPRSHRRQDARHRRARRPRPSTTHWRGQFVELSQAEAAVYLLGEQYPAAIESGIDPVNLGIDTQLPPWRLPADGDDAWIAIAIPDDERGGGWRPPVVGRPDPSLATTQARLARVDEIDERLAAWTRDRDKNAAAADLQQAGVSAMPVMGPLDHSADPHLLSRAAFDEVEHPVGGIEHHIANPTFRAPTLTAGPAPSVPTPDGSSPSGSTRRRRAGPSRRSRCPHPGPGGSVSGVKQAVDQRIDEGLPEASMMFSLARSWSTHGSRRSSRAEHAEIAPVPLPVSRTRTLKSVRLMRSSAG